MAITDIGLAVCELQEPVSRNFRSAYSRRLRCQVFPQPVREGERRGAVQSFKDVCDINNIMRKYQRTGAIDWVNAHEGQYLDVTGMTFEAAMDHVVRAQEMFDDLPSSVRKRFSNSPAEFFDFMQDASNAEEMVKLGLAVKRPEDSPPLKPEGAGPAA